MKKEEKEEYDKAVYSFGMWIISSFLKFLTPGSLETNWSFALMCWFAAFLRLLRFRYRKYGYRFWMEEIMENLILLGFALPGILGMLFFNPWIMCLASITGMSIWFILWRLYFEDFIHGFWW